MKTRIRLAVLDLDIAVDWLNQDAVELQSEVLQIIDATIDVATRNMAIVAKALDQKRWVMWNSKRPADDGHYLSL